MPQKSESPKPAEIRYPTAELLVSKALSGYQRDFAKVLLAEPAYTLQEAKAILDNYFKKGGAR